MRLRQIITEGFDDIFNTLHSLFDSVSLVTKEGALNFKIPTNLKLPSNMDIRVYEASDLEGWSDVLRAGLMGEPTSGAVFYRNYDENVSISEARWYPDNGNIIKLAWKRNHRKDLPIKMGFSDGHYVFYWHGDRFKGLSNEVGFDTYVTQQVLHNRHTVPAWGYLDSWKDRMEKASSIYEKNIDHGFVSLEDAIDDMKIIVQEMQQVINAGRSLVVDHLNDFTNEEIDQAFVDQNKYLEEIIRDLHAVASDHN